MKDFMKIVKRVIMIVTTPFMGPVYLIGWLFWKWAKETKVDFEDMRKEYLEE